MAQPSNLAPAFRTTIEKLVYGGDGLGRHRKKVTFVPFTVPGDRLMVRPVEEKKTFIRAEIVRILKAGTGRVQPPCPYFGRCGGCQWQHIEYTAQVEAKRRMLEDIFHHRFPPTRELPIAMRACPQPFAYRSRARVQMRGCGPAASVGFYRRGSHAVEDVENCPLFRPALNEALGSLRQFKLKVDTDPAPREMDMACSEEEDSWATEPIGPQSQEGISTLLGKRRDEGLLLGRRIGEFRYLTSAAVFFQTNDFMAAELVALVREAARNAGRGSAVDLYAGVGLFSLPLALQFSRVFAVENSPAACRLCASNAASAGLAHVQAVCADVSDWIRSGESSLPALPDLVVLDPPRAGAGTGVMEQIQKLAPRTIIYVSCDPQTLSRDIARISPRRYRIDLVEGLDLFPQTFHFETVVRLVRQ